MTPSLSVILPVYNAEETLAAVVGKLLETLPDLGAPFEILIVDDASTDHTAEVAYDLRRVNPQVRLVRHGWQWGLSAATRTGRMQSRGDVAIVLDSQRQVNPQELARQWVALAKGQAEARGPALGQRELPHPRSEMVRTESAHASAGAQREPSFLRHLRQLSAGA